ncbi:MAG: OmpA family protein [Pseudomonadota bacterium]|nr:OmpA family protein [Pseudomonadota bacterium]
MKAPKTMLACSLAILAPIGASHAQDRDQDYDSRPYVSILGSYIGPDTDRYNNDYGWGGRLLYGVPLSRWVNLELGGFGYFTEHEVDSHKDHTSGLSADLMFPFTQSAIRPFALLGGGYVHQNLAAKSDDDYYLNAGLGLLGDISDRVAMRTDVRYQYIDSDFGAVPGSDPLGDLMVNLGVQVALGDKPEPPAPPPPAPPPPPPDSDGDGVLDRVDQCPNTPAGVRVDSRGCPLDSDGDKVPDYMDRCPNTPVGLRVDSTGCVIEKQTIVLQNVNFEFDSAQLTASAKESLLKVARGLSDQTSMKVEIAGHTDSKGSDAYNMKLSDRRAAAVREFLISQGVSSSQLSSRGYGEEDPVADNSTETGRAQNRRVEFRVLGK